MEMQGVWVDRGQHRELRGDGYQGRLGMVAVSRRASLEVSAPVTTFWLALRGEATVESSDGRFPLHAGDWIVLERDSQPGVSSGRDGVVLGALLPATLPGAPTRGMPHIALHTGRGRSSRREARLLLRTWCESGLFARNGRTVDADPGLLMPLLRQLVALQESFLPLIDRCPGRSLQRRQQVFSRMQRAHLHLQGHLDRPLRITELARLSNISIWYFSKIFHALYGESPQSAIARLRQQRAAELLTQTMLSVGEVAIASGFDNNCSFSRAFRAHHGMPPSAYRAMAAPTPLKRGAFAVDTLPRQASGIR